MLEDLVFVLNQIKKIYGEYGLLDLYVNYANTLEQIAKESTEELQKAVKDYRKRIEEAHTKLEPNGWSYSQIEFFDKFGARSLVGKQGWQNFLDVLADNQANTPGAVAEIRRLETDLTQLITNTDNVLNSLGKISASPKLEPDEAIIEIVFDDKAGINNLADQAKFSEIWKDIIYAYSLLAGTSIEKTRIIGVSKASPFTEYLASGTLLVGFLHQTIVQFLDLKEHFLNLKSNALALENEQLILDGKRFKLMDEIDKRQREKVIEVVHQIADLSTVKGVDVGIKNTAKIALAKSAPDLYDFLTNGGKVDTSEPQAKEMDKKSFKLETKYRTVLALQERVQNLIAAGEVVKPPKKIKKKVKMKIKQKSKALKPPITASKTENSDKTKVN